jgi:hypothetical protein
MILGWDRDPNLDCLHWLGQATLKRSWGLQMFLIRQLPRAASRLGLFQVVGLPLFGQKLYHDCRRRT